MSTDRSCRFQIFESVDLSDQATMNVYNQIEKNKEAHETKESLSQLVDHYSWSTSCLAQTETILEGSSLDRLYDDALNPLRFPLQMLITDYYQSVDEPRGLMSALLGDVVDAIVKSVWISKTLFHVLHKLCVLDKGFAASLCHERAQGKVLLTALRELNESRFFNKAMRSVVDTCKELIRVENDEDYVDDEERFEEDMAELNKTFRTQADPLFVFLKRCLRPLSSYGAPHGVSPLKSSKLVALFDSFYLICWIYCGFSN
jgi:hypothetical protein